jgi:ATP-dependent Clp protease protease subunit
MKLAASFNVVKFRNAPPEVIQAAGEPDEPAGPEP